MKESLRQTPRVLVQKSLKIESGELVRFAEATGNENPIFSDAAEAKKNGYRDIIAVPTFADYFHCNEELLRELDIDEQYLTLCSQTIDWNKPLFAGDDVDVVLTLTKSNEIRNEKTCFVRFSVETAVSRKGTLVLSCNRDFYYRVISSR